MCVCVREREREKDHVYGKVVLQGGVADGHDGGVEEGVFCQCSCPSG